MGIDKEIINTIQHNNKMVPEYPLCNQDKCVFRTLSSGKKDELKDLQAALRIALFKGSGICYMDRERCYQRGIYFEIGGTAMIPIEIGSEDSEGGKLLDKVLYRMIAIEKDGNLDNEEEGYPSGYGRNMNNLQGLCEMAKRAITHFEAIGSAQNYDKACVLEALREVKRVIELIREWYLPNIMMTRAFSPMAFEPEEVVRMIQKKGSDANPNPNQA